MAISYNVKVTGLEEVLKNLAAYGERARQAADAAVYEEAQAIEQTSVTRYVPVDTGQLRSDMAFVDTVKREGEIVSCTFGYRGPYAASVHENPRAGRTGGWPPNPHDPPLFRWIDGRIVPIGGQRKTWASVGQFKFLETPLLEAENGMLSRLADRMRTILGGKP
jgi:hypothetical protein